MRPPIVLALGSSLTLWLAACESGVEPEARAAVERIRLDERACFVGDVVERLDTDGYVYLRLSLVRDTANPQLRPHSQLRWVALDGDAPELGERVQVRSLARRSRVWEPALERDFEVLDYVARIP